MKSIITAFSFAIILLTVNSLLSQITQQWAVRYNFPGNEYQTISTSVQVDPQGNVYITGYSSYEDSLLNSYYDWITIKYNSSGVQQWMQTYHYGIPNDMVVDNFGNVYVAGVGFDSLTNVMLQVEMEFLNYYICKLNRKEIPQCQKKNATHQSKKLLFSEIFLRRICQSARLLKNTMFM